MKAITCALAVAFICALLWRLCASDNEAPLSSSEHQQDTRFIKPGTLAPEPGGGSGQTHDSVPGLAGKAPAAVINSHPQAPGETARAYQDRMDVVRGLEAFRQRAGIGEERYRTMLMAIYDHQYNWARFQEAHPDGEGLSLAAYEQMIRDMSRALRSQLLDPMTIEERMIWLETCPRCSLKIMFGTDMVQLGAEPR